MDDITRQEPHLRFRDLWRRYEDLVRWYCLRAAHGRLDRACDLVQQVALRLIEQCDTIRCDAGIPSERVWLHRVIRSAIADAKATDKKIPKSQPDNVIDTYAADDHDAELNALLDDLADGLSDEERRFLRYYRDGFDINDLAILYDLTYNAASTRLTRIRQKLMLRARQLHYIK